jgi:predicted DNA-binding transcriptional regulator AlpA
MLSFHVTTIYRIEHRGDFPQLIRLGPQSVGYYKDEISAWLKAKVRIISKLLPAKALTPVVPGARVRLRD